jgi:tetratricopeptide (TPR) repeat protein
MREISICSERRCSAGRTGRNLIPSLIGHRLYGFRTGALLAILLLALIASPAFAQSGGGRVETEVPVSEEARQAADLTRRGKFQDAIPLFVAALREAPEDFAIKFNLALCYVALGEFDKAIPLLNSFPGSQRNANVENLLAQSYMGTGQSDKAFASVQRAAKSNPRDEKLYLYIADACNAYADYELGLKTVELGLEKLPRAARLHYRRAVFLSLLEVPEEANRAFDQAIKLAGGESIGYVAAAHKNLLSGNVGEALRAARQGVRQSKPDILLLSFLGEALIRTGVVPGDPEFAEASGALEQALAERPSYSPALIALAKLHLLEQRWSDAIGRLEAARQLEPRNPTVYSNLAQAYRLSGDQQRAQQVLAILARINQEHVERIRSAPGERKAVYGRTVHP